MDQIQGKHFSITDPQNVNTVIYQINKTEQVADENSPKFTLERLKCREELVGQNKKKTFFVDSQKDVYNQLVILSFGQDKVVVNSGLLEGDKIKISRQPSFVKFDTLDSEESSSLDDSNSSVFFKYNSLTSSISSCAICSNLVLSNE